MDIDIYKSDEEKGEALKAWIHKNGISVVGGVLIGLAVIFGGRSWLEYGAKQSEHASYLYSQMMDAVGRGDNDMAFLLQRQLVDDYNTTPYASSSSMISAKIKQAQGDIEGATADLHWVMSNAKLSSQVHGARLRLVRTLLANKQLDIAQQELSSIKNMGDFVASYEDVQGDIYVAQMQPQQARAAYQRALDALASDASIRSFLEIKRNSITGS